MLFLLIMWWLWLLYHEVRQIVSQCYISNFKFSLLFSSLFLSVLSFFVYLSVYLSLCRCHFFLFFSFCLCLCLLFLLFCIFICYPPCLPPCIWLPVCLTFYYFISLSLLLSVSFFVIVLFLPFYLFFLSSTSFFLPVFLFRSCFFSLSRFALSSLFFSLPHCFLFFLTFLSVYLHLSFSLPSPLLSLSMFPFSSPSSYLMLFLSSPSLSKERICQAISNLKSTVLLSSEIWGRSLPSMIRNTRCLQHKKTQQHRNPLCNNFTSLMHDSVNLL